MKRKLSSLLLILILIFNFTGCFNYREINKITFATSIIFDKDENDNVVIYLDCVRPYRDAGDSSDQGLRVLFKGEGKTALEAIRTTDAISSNKLNFSQVRAYIFTESAAQDGIKKYIDLINNSQEFGFKPYMFVYFGEVENLLDVIGNDKEYLGLYLDQLIENNKGNGKLISSNINDYITDTLTGEKISIVSALEIKEDTLEKKAELNGGVVIKNNKLVKRLPINETLSYNILMNPVKEGTFEVQNPNETDKFVTLDILNKNINKDIKVKDGRVIFNNNVDIRVSIGEIQGKLVVDNEVLNLIKNVQEKKVENYLTNIFKDYTENNIDILGVSKLLEQKYPNSNIEDPLNNTDFNVNVNIIIDGSSLIRDSL